MACNLEVPNRFGFSSAIQQIFFLLFVQYLTTREDSILRLKLRDIPCNSSWLVTLYRIHNGQLHGQRTDTHGTQIVPILLKTRVKE